MPDNDRAGTVEVPILGMFQDLSKQIDTLDRRLGESLAELARQIKLDHSTLVGRMEGFETWRIRHESGDGHPALSGDLRAADKRLDLLEQEARDAQTRDADREKREGRRYAVLGVLLTAALVLGTFLTVFLPLLQHHP